MRKVMFVAILTACVAAGCAGRRPVEAGAGAELAPSKDPKAAVIDASKKFIALPSLSARVDAVGETPYSKDIKYVAPDRYYVLYRDAAGAEIEMLMDPSASYVKSGDSWSEVPGDTNPTPTMRNSFTDEVLETISDVKFEGEDLINGSPVLMYSYKLVTKVGNFPVTQKIWVSKSSGIPVKCFVEYSNGPLKTLTTTFDTESPVTVDLPVK